MDLEAVNELKTILAEEIYKHIGLVETFTEYEEKCTLSEVVYPKALQSCIGTMLMVVDMLQEMSDLEETELDEDLADDDAL